MSVMQDTVVQGHTVRYIRHDNYVFCSCLDCGFISKADNLEEAKFDGRYHALKNNLTKIDIDWSKLL